MKTSTPLVWFLAGWFGLFTGLFGKDFNLVENPGMESVQKVPDMPDGYVVTGNAFWGRLGGTMDIASNGIIFPGKAPKGGEVSQMIRGLDQSKGRWITFRFRGLAEDGFELKGETLRMKIDFYSKGGSNFMDSAARDLDPEILRERKDLTKNGNYGKGGAAVWRTYELEELLPFHEVDAVRISVSYDRGTSEKAIQSAFLVDDFSLVQHALSRTGRVDPAEVRPEVKAMAVEENKLYPLGGRWYYQPGPNEKELSRILPLTVTEENADRLFYKSARFVNPFLNNMTAWIRAGYLDETGQLVTADRLVADSVVLTFKGDGYLTVRSKNIPNHPTAKFPGFNPSYIRIAENIYRLPLDPQPDPAAKAMDEADRNGALPMGPIGVAVNGVVFYNPFDAGMTDASSIMDYCCGHPNQDNQYHYHKYPICVNTAFVEKGEGHSEVIGFAFDGLPVYGPYESAGVMAKDLTVNPLNAFNAHFDQTRGWHYHVTPGKFPYLIGGFYARAEGTNFMRGPRRGGGPPPMMR